MREGRRFGGRSRVASARHAADMELALFMDEPAYQTDMRVFMFAGQRAL